MNTPTILLKILQRKGEEVAERSAQVSIDELCQQIRLMLPGDLFRRCVILSPQGAQR